MVYVDYDEYIHSDEWAEKSRIFIEQVGCCENGGCRSKKNLECHHLNYDNLGNETIEDVRVLCERCHKEEHLKEKEENKSGEEDRRWKEIIPTLSPTIKARFEVKEKPIEIKPIEVISKPKFKSKLKDYNKQVYYDKEEKKFKKYTYFGWLKKIIELMKRLSKPFKFKHKG